MNRPRIIGAAILLFIMWTVGQVSAQTKAMTTEEMARRADVVAIGKVTATKSEWDQNKSRIVTRATMNVGEYVKGNAGSVMTFTTLGGEVDGVGEWYSHVARFTKDEEVVVFAEKDKKVNYRVTGGSEGKIPIKRDERTWIARVSSQITLDDFKSRIKQALNPQQEK